MSIRRLTSPPRCRRPLLPGVRLRNSQNSRVKSQFPKARLPFEALRRKPKLCRGSAVVQIHNGPGTPIVPLTGRVIRGGAGGVLPVYRRSHRAASCSSGDSVAELGLSRASCYIGVSNSIPVLLPPLLDNRSFGCGQDAGGQIVRKWTKNAGGVCGRDGIEGRSLKSGPLGLSVSVLVLRWRPGRSPGPGRLTTQVGAGDHPGDDAQPATQRLPLLCGVRWRSPLPRRPAIGRWILSVGRSHPVPSASESFPGQGVVHDGPGVRRPV